MVLEDQPTVLTAGGHLRFEVEHDFAEPLLHLLQGWKRETSSRSGKRSPSIESDKSRCTCSAYARCSRCEMTPSPIDVDGGQHFAKHLNARSEAHADGNVIPLPR